MLRKVASWFLQRRRAVVPVKALPAVLPAPEWTRECVTDFAKFLSTSTGQAFLQRARAMQNHLAHQSVRAASIGETLIPTFADAIDWVESLAKVQTFSRVTGAQATHDEPPPEGETALLERMSP